MKWNFDHFSNFLSSSCKHEQKPEYYEQCDAGECPKWESGSWSECSTSCGDGYKRRLIACRYSNGTVLDDSKCRSREKPDFNLKCSEKKCSIGSWTVGNWSKVISILILYNSYMIFI